jgi:hypothetical protein
VATVYGPPARTQIGGVPLRGAAIILNLAAVGAFAPLVAGQLALRRPRSTV